MKKILSLLLAFSLLNISMAAAASPQYSITPDCDTADKNGKIGLVSDPDDPDNGPEIIAFKLEMNIDPAGSTTYDDIKNARIEANSAFNNIIIAENTAEKVSGSHVKINISGGFTPPGINNTEALLYIKGIREKEYKVTFISGELFAKNSTDNIFVNNPPQVFNLDPTSCDQQSNGSGNSNTNNQNTPVGTTSIALTTDSADPQPGQQVSVTATIQNLGNKELEWVQTAGSPITPEIVNTQLSSTEAQSVVSFKIPSDITTNETITLRLRAGTTVESIDLEINTGQEGELRGSADTSENQSAADDLRERLRQRREEAIQQGSTTPAADQGQASIPEEPGNIHGSAGALSQSGPEDMVWLLLLAGLMTAMLSYRNQRSISE